MLSPTDFPNDIDALKAMLVAAFKQAMFGRKSEKIDPDQFELALEDIETAIAAIHAEDDAVDPAKTRPAKPRNANRGSLPKHLLRIEEVIEPDTQICGCGGNLHQIGDDASERLNVIPAQFRVIVTRRPKYACRSCSNGVVQAPAPARLIPGGMPTEATVAHVLVCKYADHLPLYRQAQIYSRQGIDLDRSTLAAWVGKAAYELKPVFNALIADLKRSTKLFMDETRAPVLDPKAGKTKTDTSGLWPAMTTLGVARPRPAWPLPTRRGAAGNMPMTSWRTSRAFCRSMATPGITA
jgi:transposase